MHISFSFSAIDLLRWFTVFYHFIVISFSLSISILTRFSFSSHSPSPMDFVDFDTLNLSDDLPQPQPALSLPITSNIETFGRKFFNLNTITRSLLKSDNNTDTEKSENHPQVAEKYANLSLLLVEDPKNAAFDHQQPHSDTRITALSARLSRVLNNPLSDSQIRDIFGSLEDTLRSWDGILEPGALGSMLRRKLRGEIERTLIRNQTQTLKEYQPVIKNLRNLEANIEALKSTSMGVVDSVNNDFESSETFNSKMENLHRKKTAVVVKKHMLSAFKAKFTLNEYEEYTLENGDISDEFFTVLAKAEQVDQDCSILLSIDNSQLGVKTMARVNRLVTRASEKVVAYANRTLANLYALNNRDRVRTLHQCFLYLRQKPHYLNSVLATFVGSRSKTLVDEFLGQANSRVAGSSLQSEEYQDPVRVIGDLLAYIHSVVVSESETILGVFAFENDLADDTSREEFAEIMNDCVAKVLQSLAKPVRAKLEQIISREVRILVLFSIHNLVALYYIMFSKQIKQDHMGLVATIESLVESAESRIVTTVENKLTTIRNSNLAQLQLNIDLQPPEWIIDFYSEILPMLDQTHGEAIFKQLQEKNNSFVNMVVDQPIQIYEQHIENSQVKNFEKRDKYMLQLNCLDLILSKIMPISVLTDKVISVNEKIKDVSDKLVETQVSSLLEESGLTDFYNIANMICPIDDEFFDVSIYEPITENKLFTEEAVREVNVKIQAFLPTALLDIQQSLFKINSPLVVNEIITESAIKYARFYGRFRLICDEYLKVPLLGWSDGEVATLLGVEDAYFHEQDSNK